MLVRSLRATNFMKFEELAIAGLPRRGTVGIRGPNESGKTSLGEAITFALFGRTPRVSADDPSPLIRWETERLRVILEFEAGDHVYEVERELHRAGRFAATLRRLPGDGEASDSEASATAVVVAETPSRVTKEISRLMGFGYEEFRYSFYLAQKELDIVRHERRDNTRAVVDSMVGITALQRASQIAREQRDELREKSETLVGDLAVARALLNTLEPDSKDRDELEEKLRDHDSRVEDARTRLDGLDQRIQGLRVATVARAKAQQLWERLRRASLWRHHNDTLVAGRGSLRRVERELAAASEAAASKIEESREALEQCDETTARVRELGAKLTELEGLVALYHSELQREFEEGEPSGVDRGWGAGTKAEKLILAGKRHEQLGGQRRFCLGWFVVAVIMALGALVAGQLLPDLVSDEVVKVDMGALGTRIIERQKLQLAFWVVASVCVASALSFFLRRRGLTSRADELQQKIVNLESELDWMREAAKACSHFTTGRLAQVGTLVRKLEAREIDDRFGSLERRYDEFLQRDVSINDLLVEQRESRAELRGTLQREAPACAVVERLRRVVSRELVQAQALLGDGGSEADEGLELALPTHDSDAMEREVESTLVRVSRARMELTGLSSGDGDVEVAGGLQGEDPALLAERLQTALDKFFEAMADDDRRCRWQEEADLGSVVAAALVGNGGTEAAAEGEDAVEPDPLSEALNREGNRLVEFLGSESSLWDQVAQVDGEAATVKEMLLLGETRRSASQARLATLSAQLERRSAMRQKVDALEDELVPVRHELAVRKTLIELLEDCVVATRRNLGPSLSRYMARVLPRLTAGRYRRVKIDDDLDIRVFSGERNEYVRLIDLSFGTTDQILLALRLGLASSLASLKGDDGEQFLFLDEPVSSFDSERAGACLKLLEDHDQRFSQVFVVSHAAGISADAFSKLIELKTDMRRLMVD